MADSEENKNVLSENDTLDINELASLNDDISPELIEQLQSQVSKSANQFTGKASVSENDDSQLFEEVSGNAEGEEEHVPVRINIDANVDDNFIKKYKARLNKQQQSKEETDKTEELPAHPAVAEDKADAEPVKKPEPPEADQNVPNEKPAHVKEETTVNESATTEVEPPKIVVQNEPVSMNPPLPEQKNIENVTSGNIVEKPITTEQKSYNDSLDLLDENVKYAKYVIYIDPENKDFIDSLTVKERKNIINKILRQQDDIAITKNRLRTVRTVIMHSIIAIITVALSIPIIYYTINASLEATINNHRRSQNLFQTLYKEHGKIRTNSIK